VQTPSQEWISTEQWSGILWSMRRWLMVAQMGILLMNEARYWASINWLQSPCNRFHFLTYAWFWWML
jgi:hypothetical protein